MSVSRDEAREVAIIALVGTIGLRLGAALLQAFNELSNQAPMRAVLARFFAPIGPIVGLLALSAVLVVILSPRGSVTSGMRDLCRRMAGLVGLLGALGAFHTLAFGFSELVTRLELVMTTGLAAAVLAGTGWWLMRNLDGDR